MVATQIFKGTEAFSIQLPDWLLGDRVPSSSLACWDVQKKVLLSAAVTLKRKP